MFVDDADARSDADFSQQAVTAMAGYRLASGYSVRVAAGAILGGELSIDGPAGERTFEMDPGLVASIAGARTWSFGASQAWHVTGSIGLAGSHTRTSERDVAGSDVGLTSFDLRLGATAGRTFFDIWQPYLLARLFAGPVSWTVDQMDITGGDKTHVQLGLGSSVATRFGLSVVADVSVLGERSASLGLAWTL